MDYSIPEEASGMGLVDAARGALGHWIKIKEHKIANYQCVVPSTWNFGPRDDKGQPGPVEQALVGTKVKDASNPFEIVRIKRDAVPPNTRARIKRHDTKGFCKGRFQDFPNIEVHSVTKQGEFVHKSNIDGTKSIFKYFTKFSCHRV